MSELVRLAPDSLIVQHYVQDRQLKSLSDWSRLKSRPFTIFTMDDLLTDLPPDNFMRQFMAPNSRACLKYALDRCDRLVVSTEFLADYYRSFISDIRVVPNRLEQEVWLPLTSRKRVSPRPRIGWAGGTTHHGDLLLLREVIEQTRGEADWVFFGMCPDELRRWLPSFTPSRPSMSIRLDWRHSTWTSPSRRCRITRSITARAISACWNMEHSAFRSCAAT